MKNKISSMILLVGLISYILPIYSMLSNLEGDIVAAVKNGNHSILMEALASHETALCSQAGQVLKNYMPNANVALGDVKTAAEMVSAIAGIIPGGASVAAVAGDIESVAGAVQQGTSASAGGSASSASKNSPLVQAALDAEKAAQAGTGIGSRTLAAGICLFSLTALGIKGYTDWFSTNSSSSENQSAQRVSAYVSDLPTFTGLLTAAGASGYYALKNKWYKDQIATAKVTTATVTNHVNTTTALSEAVAHVKKNS